MVELAVSMAVLMVLTAIAIPSLMHSFRTYQLNDTAARLSDMLKFTRFEAVRKNKAVPFQLQQFGNDWVAWEDPDNDANLDATEKQVRISGFVTLLPAGGGPPVPTAITNALNVGGLAPTPANPGPLQFDARGAVLRGWCSQPRRVRVSRRDFASFRRYADLDRTCRRTLETNRLSWHAN